MFVERWDLLVNTHTGLQTRDAGVLKALTLCSVNSRKISYGNYATACLWPWQAFLKTFSGVNIALYSVPFSKSLLIKTTIKQHLKCAKYAFAPSSLASFRFVGQKERFATNECKNAKGRLW